jgi:uncharacterized protein (DUF927 family)
MKVVTQNILPENFLVQDDGIYFVSGNRPAQWICSRLDVVAETRSHRGDNWGRLLRFRDKDGVSHEWAMPMSMLAGDGSEYREQLLALGLEIAPGRDARNKLSIYIQTSHPNGKARSVNRIGWHGDSFVLQDGVFSSNGSDRVLLQGAREGHSVARISGTLEEWKETVALPSLGNSRLMFALSVSFAAPLLYLAGEEGGGFHFQGKSSIGKTTLLHVAGSVWGGGGMRGYLNTWRTTSSGLELIAASHCDSLLALDELNEVSPRQIGEIAYMLANGSGKGRASGSHRFRQVDEWRLLFLSTGEVSLSRHIQDSRRELKAGQLLRMIDIPADAGHGSGLFEDLGVFPTGDAFSRALRDGTRKNYGTAIRAFLSQIVPSSHSVRASVKAAQRKFVEDSVLSDNGGETIRVVNRFGLVAAAGELAIESGILPWPKGSAKAAARTCFNAWLEAREPVQDAEKAIRIARLFLKENSERFIPLDGRANTQVSLDQTIGFVRGRGPNIAEWLILPKAFQQQMCREISSLVMTKALISRGWLITDQAGKSSCPVTLPEIGKKRVYRIKSDIFEGTIGVPTPPSFVKVRPNMGLLGEDTEHNQVSEECTSVPAEKRNTGHTLAVQECT